MDGFDTPQSQSAVDSDDFEGASGDDSLPVPTLEVGDLVTCGTVYDKDKFNFFEEEEQGQEEQEPVLQEEGEEKTKFMVIGVNVQYKELYQVRVSSL